MNLNFRPVVTFIVAIVMGFCAAAGIAALRTTDKHSAASVLDNTSATVKTIDASAPHDARDGEIPSSLAQPAPFISELEREYLEIEKQLGPPNVRRRATPQEAFEMIDNLPSRFDEVTRKLAEAERKNDRDSANAPAPMVPEDKTVIWRQLTPGEMTKMAADTEADFAAVNHALGVSSQSDRAQDAAVQAQPRPARGK